MNEAGSVPAKSISLWQSILFLILWLLAFWIMWNWSSAGSFAPAFGGIVLAVFALLLLYQSYLYMVAPEKGNLFGLVGRNLAIFAIIVLLLAAGLFSREILGTLFCTSLMILTLIAMGISLPQIFARMKRETENRKGIL